MIWDVFIAFPIETFSKLGVKIEKLGFSQFQWHVQRILIVFIASNGIRTIISSVDIGQLHVLRTDALQS